MIPAPRRKPAMIMMVTIRSPSCLKNNQLLSERPVRLPVAKHVPSSCFIIDGADAMNPSLPVHCPSKTLSPGSLAHLLTRWLPVATE